MSPIDPLESAFVVTMLKGNFKVESACIDVIANEELKKTLEWLQTVQRNPTNENLDEMVNGSPEETQRSIMESAMMLPTDRAELLGVLSVLAMKLRLRRIDESLSAISRDAIAAGTFDGELMKKLLQERAGWLAKRRRLLEDYASKTAKNAGAA